MTRYRVEYGLDVPAYGEVEIEADSQVELVTKIHKLYSEDMLIDSWDTMPEVGCENHRVVSIFELVGEEWRRVDDGFDLNGNDDSQQVVEDTPYDLSKLAEMGREVIRDDVQYDHHLVEIDALAGESGISEGEDGVWVRAWVLVTKDRLQKGGIWPADSDDE